MSSSRRFVGLFWGMVAGGVLATLVLTLAVDPYGALAPNFRTPTVCPEGIKSGLARQSKVLVPAIIRPRTVLLGTSRAMLGFDGPALAVLGPRPANLGVENAQPRDFVALAKATTQWGKVDAAYIGIDFTTFYGRETPALAPAPEPTQSLRGAALSNGLFSIDAVRAAILALRDCRPRFGTDGSPAYAGDVPVWLGATARGVGLEEVMRSRAEGVAEFGPLVEKDRTAQLAEALRLFRGHGARVVLFIAPYSREVIEDLASDGMGPRMTHWRAEMAAAANAEGALFADFSSPDTVASLALPACRDGGTSCHYYDHVHYDRDLGRALAQRLAALGGRP